MREKNLGTRTNDSYILKTYIAEYSITSLSRYKHLEKLSVYNKGIINSTPAKRDMGITPKQTTTFVVTAAEENRIDVVATKVYGNASLYWAICYMNGISDPLSLAIGTVLTIPDLKGLFQYPNPLA